MRLPWTQSTDELMNAARIEKRTHSFSKLSLRFSVRCARLRFDLLVSLGVICQNFSMNFFVNQQKKLFRFFGSVCLLYVRAFSLRLNFLFYLAGNAMNNKCNQSKSHSMPLTHHYLASHWISMTFVQHHSLASTGYFLANDWIK